MTSSSLLCYYFTSLLSNHLDEPLLPVAAADERWHWVAADADRRGAQQPERQRRELPPRGLALDERLDALRPESLAADGTADDEHLRSHLHSLTTINNLGQGPLYSLTPLDLAVHPSLAVLFWYKIPPFPETSWEKCRPRASKTALGLPPLPLLPLLPLPRLTLPLLPLLPYYYYYYYTLSFMSINIRSITLLLGD